MIPVAPSQWFGASGSWRLADERTSLANIKGTWGLRSVILAKQETTIAIELLRACTPSSGGKEDQRSVTHGCFQTDWQTSREVLKTNVLMAHTCVIHGLQPPHRQQHVLSPMNGKMRPLQTGPYLPRCWWWSEWRGAMPHPHQKRCPGSRDDGFSLQRKLRPAAPGKEMRQAILPPHWSCSLDCNPSKTSVLGGLANAWWKQFKTSSNSMCSWETLEGEQGQTGQTCESCKVSKLMLLSSCNFAWYDLLYCRRVQLTDCPR